MPVPAISTHIIKVTFCFPDKLEKATIQTIEEGVMTGDLAALSTLENKKKVDTEEFLIEINERLKKMM